MKRLWVNPNEVNKPIMKPEQILEEVIRKLARTYWNYNFKPNEWFFPSDVSPHSTSFKYKCKKLHALGMLERQGDSSDRWGYRYRVPNNEVESDIEL